MRAVLNLEPDRYSAQAKSVLEGFGRVDDGPLTRPELLSRIGDYDAIIVRFGHRIDAELIAAGTRLKAIACAATGTDHIDVAAAERRGIAVVSLRNEPQFLRRIPASAECSWALLLALMRRLPAAYESARRGIWNRDAFVGRDLSGKNIAILGCGRIGEKVARFARAFEMQVLAFDPYRRKMPTGVTRAKTLDELVCEADVLMVNASLTDETKRIVNAAVLDAMPPRAVLVNTSRGALVDESALLQALRTGRLSGAALDVLEDESPAAIARNPLVSYAAENDNLILTPHIGGATQESMAATEIFVARRLAALLGGTP